MIQRNSLTLEDHEYWDICYTTLKNIVMSGDVLQLPPVALSKANQ
jgi:hypothetical protein